MEGQDEKIIQLLANADFRKWVTAPTEEQDIYWKKWMDSHKEQCDAVAKAKELIIRFRFKQDLLSETEQELILNRVISMPKESIRSGIELFYWLKVAAVISIFISVGFLFYRNLSGIGKMEPEVLAQQITIIEKKNPQGKKSQFVLPDGTKVYLNSESELMYPERFSDTARVVQLNGEGYFEVAPDSLRPFSVQSKNIVTTALGTSFNVRAFAGDDDVNVALVTGKISVKSDDYLGDNFLLNPGEMIILGVKNQRAHITGFDMVSETGWKDGILIFENTGFPEFVQKIERWYGVKVTISGKPAGRWNIDGQFKNESLEEILKGVSFTHDVRYKIDNRNVELRF
jgi:transmembrane sensor